MDELKFDSLKPLAPFVAAIAAFFLVKKLLPVAADQPALPAGDSK